MNAYEMDILRLLHLFAPENHIVKDMVSGTFKRLEKSCPGGDCCQGECFHSSLPVIRFFSVAALDKKEWLKKLVDKINKGLAAFSEYSYIKNRQPYINEKNGRLCFDVNPTY